MITFLRLGTKGNLGNQLFQIASTIGLSKKHDHPFAFPDWEYSKFFDVPLPFLENPDMTFITLIEKEYNYHEWPIGTENYNILGWLQSEKYFDIQETKKYFKFKAELVSQIRNKHEDLLEENAILISVRRGDFVHHPRFFQLKYNYYLLALMHNFPDWKTRKLIFTSDDINYCRRHFGFLQRAIFVEDLSPIEQLILGAQFHHFVISNSTFSWWMAWLGEKESSKIIRPKKNFRGKYAKSNNDEDFFPQRWIILDHQRHKLSLKYYNLIFSGELEEAKLWLQFQFKTFKRFVNRILERSGRERN